MNEICLKIQIFKSSLQGSWLQSEEATGLSGVGPSEATLKELLTETLRAFLHDDVAIFKVPLLIGRFQSLFRSTLLDLEIIIQITGSFFVFFLRFSSNLFDFYVVFDVFSSVVLYNTIKYKYQYYYSV